MRHRCGVGRVPKNSLHGGLVPEVPRHRLLPSCEEGGHLEHVDTITEGLESLQVIPEKNGRTLPKLLHKELNMPGVLPVLWRFREAKEVVCPSESLQRARVLLHIAPHLLVIDQTVGHDPQGGCALHHVCNETHAKVIKMSTTLSESQVPLQLFKCCTMGTRRKTEPVAAIARCRACAA